MTDKEIVEALIAHDAKVTQQFFYTDCRPLFISIIRNIFGPHTIDYDEIINEIYVLLMEKDARRLREFDFRSTLFKWLKTTAIRHCLRLKEGGKVIDNESKEPLDKREKDADTTESSQAKMDLERLLSQMKNQRYVMVIRLLVIDDRPPEEVASLLMVKVENLYNIKRRAMLALTDVALKDKRHYER